jgi:hypothetical protein
MLTWGTIRPAVAVALLSALVGCAGGSSGPPVRDPGDTVSAWRAAVANDDPRAAYALLSPRVRAELTYSEFERQWKATAVERKRQVEAMGADGGELEAAAQLTLADGKKTRLVREAGGWRLETPLLTSSRASSPQEAMRLFATALEDRNFYAVARLLTSTRRDGLNAQLDAFVAGLRGSVGREVTIQGDRAIIEWKEGAKTWRVTLKREEGEWRIDDIDY